MKNLVMRILHKLDRCTAVLDKVYGHDSEGTANFIVYQSMIEV